MAMERKFLGWHKPALRLAVDELQRMFSRDGRWDLGQVLIVTPGRRAGRRLLEQLTEAGAGLALTPPELTTPSELPEALYEPTQPIAESLHALLTRAHALQRAEPEVIGAIMPRPLEPHDFIGYLNLARQLEQLHTTLAGDGYTFTTAMQRATGEIGPNALPDFDGELRWTALATLQADYEKRLAAEGFADRQVARREAAAAGQGRCEKHIVLLGVVELLGNARKLLRTVAADPESPGITALIQAPESEADSFDDLGCVKPGAWSNRMVDLSACVIEVVDRPHDQAIRAVQLIKQASDEATNEGNPPLAADDITVGLGDEQEGPMVERTLELAGAAARLAGGTPVLQSRPARLLDAIAQYLQRSRLEELAALLRHPDLHAYLTRLNSDAAADGDGATDGEDNDHPAIAEPSLFAASRDEATGRAASWITALDEYRAQHMVNQFPEGAPADEHHRETVMQAHEAVQQLLPEDWQTSRPLPMWSDAIAELLTKVYGDTRLHRHEADDWALIGAIRAVGDALREQAELSPEDPAVPTLSLRDAIELTLLRLAESAVAPMGGQSAIELLGWLELPLDDAPMLLITSVNEGSIPSSQNADMFLPDQLRSHLGLPCNHTRHARDLLLMTAIVHSRNNVCLLATRRGTTDEPRPPSRLLLACDHATLTQRVEAFYNDESVLGRPAALEKEFGPLIAPGKTNRFLIPPPSPDHAALTRLSVSAFRQYIACPYRFYLRYITRLRGLDDRATEMGADVFGSLAHDVLDDFAGSRLARSSSARDIAAWLSTQLDARALARFGNHPNAAIRIQLEQLRPRFEAFAHWQAAQADAGWQIIREGSETSHQTVLQVDGQAMMVTGRIDRIDRHKSGRLRVIDYKTGDSASKPRNAHCKSSDESLEWLDLQLPLYRRMVSEHPQLAPPDANTNAGAIELGYVALPKDLSKVGFMPAEWTMGELTHAVDTACDIVRDIRAGVFWPPSPPPTWADEFTSICADNALTRDEIIEASTTLS